MSKVCVGVDPDSEAHGIGVYRDGELVVCASATTCAIILDHLPVWREWGDVVFSIENVMANNFCYDIKLPKNTPAHTRKKIEQDRMRKTGRCQQAQVELMRWLDRHQVPYVLHKPQSGNWSKNKALFERITGWTGRSNEDSRSGAYFGWLEERR